MKTHYFSPGPAILPKQVREKLHSTFLDTFGFGVGIMEISHRSKEYSEINEYTHHLAKQVFQVPDTHQVFFTPFGAQQHFCLLMNQLSQKNDLIAYCDTGIWAHLAVAEAMRSERKVVLAFDGRKNDYKNLGNITDWNLPKESKYLHLTVNNTVYGTEYEKIPDNLGIPLVLDMTSSIGARQDIPWEKTAVVYASAQKNFGIAGVSIMIVHNETLEQMKYYAQINHVGHALSYYAMFAAKSALNTPPTYPIYCASVMLDWMNSQGGTAAMETLALKKAKRIYDVLDAGFYTVRSEKKNRSRHNFVFKCPTLELDEKLIDEAYKQGIREIRGYRQVGGIRCSVYNGVSLESTEYFASFLEEFRNKNG